MRASRYVAATGIAVALTTGLGAAAPSATVPALVVPAAFMPAGCSAMANPTGPPAYYAIELVPTRRVPGTGSAAGVASVTFARSPFGVAVAPDGTHVHALDVRITNLRPRRGDVFAVWVASADLDQVRLLGVLDEDFRLHGQVSWNKYLVVVSLEDSARPPGDRWQGPIVMRGMSRSGMMHTMAGHGPFEAEPCIKYGYK